MISIYTVITGNFDNLRPPKQEALSPTRADCQFTCFSDRPRQVWPWRIQPFPQVGSARLNSRVPKILPHLLLPEADFSIYMDGAFRLQAHPRDVIARLGDADIALFQHAKHHSIHDEYQHYLNLQGWVPEDVETEYRYLTERSGLTVEGDFYAGGVIVRRHSPAVAAFNEIWAWNHVNGSDNDQFSLWASVKQAGLKVAVLPGDILFSDQFGYSMHSASGCQDNPLFEPENADWESRVATIRDLFTPAEVGALCSR